MSAQPEIIKLTYEDYAALPDDGMRYEVLNGDLFMSPSPQIFHQRVLARLVRILSEHVEKEELGEVFLAPLDVLLSKHDIVEPDIIFVSQARSHFIKEKNIEGVPDLLVEVLSPTRPELDTTDKRNVYGRCGVPHYWIVDAEARVLTELQLKGKSYATSAEAKGDQTFQPALFPGLNIDLGWVWSGKRK